MTVERYKRIYDWFGAHPRCCRAVIFGDRWLALVPFVAYPILIVLLNAQLFSRLAAGQSVEAMELMQDIARAVFVPAFTLWLGTFMRRKLNRPRPYDQPGFVPLVEKTTRGHSFPSRHTLSASVLAAVWMFFYPAAGWIMTLISVLIGVLRVLVGVHAPVDVAAGFVMGFVLGFFGMRM
ncbi:MAG: phosphatase PAP2 family protein [Faecalibacterium sp.]